MKTAKVYRINKFFSGIMRDNFLAFKLVSYTSLEHLELQSNLPTADIPNSGHAINSGQNV